MKMFFLLLVTTLISISSHAAVTVLDKDEWKFMIGGFAETDMFYDSTRSYTEVEGSTAIARTNTYNGDNGRTQFSLRNSRFAFTVLPPVQNEVKTKAYLEFDLLGYEPTPTTISEAAYLSNPTLRLRHGYMSADTSGWLITVGQYWSLFGWNPTYVLTTAGVSPVAGTLYERTSQAAAVKTIAMGDVDKINLGASLERPVQRDSQIPNLNLGAKYSLGGRKSGFSSASGEIGGEPFSIAVSGTYRQFIAPTVGGSTADTTRYAGGAVAVNTMIPIVASDDGKNMSNTLTLSGEFSSGSGYADAFSGWSGNIPQLPTTGSTAPISGTNLDAGQGGFDTSGNFTLAKLQTWNAQLQYHMGENCHSFITLGYGQLYFLNSTSFTPSTGNILYDKPEVYFANFFHDFTKQVRVAFEYARSSTHYVDGITANNNRYQVSTWIRF